MTVDPHLFISYKLYEDIFFSYTVYDHTETNAQMWYGLEFQIWELFFGSTWMHTNHADSGIGISTVD